MTITITNPTGTSALSNLDIAAYDKFFEFGLRSEPYFRSWVDKRPVDVTNPGESVTFNLWTDFAPVTSALTEAVTPDPVAASNTTQVTVTLAEYGNLLQKTKRLQEVALSNVDAGLANMMAYNCLDSIDAIIAAKLRTAVVQLGRLTGGAFTYQKYDGTGAAPTAITSVVATDVIASAQIRSIIATLRANKVVPRFGSDYLCTLHPYVSADLRAETGNAAWREPHNFSAAGNIWSGVIGEYEGAVFVESPRAYSAQSGNGSGGTQVRVFDTFFLGQQAIVEAVNVEPHIVAGPVIDPLLRSYPLGWYAFLGWNVFRPQAIFRYQTASTGQPNV